MAILAALAVVFVCAKATFAQEIYNPCWAQVECLDANVGGVPSSQPNRGLCDTQHCFEPGGGCPSGQGKCYTNPPPVPLTVTIGGSARVIDVGDYIAKVYNYGVSIAGIIAGVVFVIGGFQYLTAGGDAGRVSKAKDRIRDALVGLLLVFSAYVILNTVNPDILRLQMPKVPLVKKVLFVACQYFELEVPCGMPFTLVKIPNVSDTAPLPQRYRMAVESDRNSGSGTVTTTCYGKSCSRAGFDDATHTCRRPPATPGAPAAATNTNTAAPPNTSGINVVPANACAPQPTAPWQCLPCKRSTETCRGAGPNSECCGGFCAGGAIRSALGGFGSLAGSAGVSGPAGVLEGRCTNGANGSQCGVNAECFSRHCADTGGTGLGGQCVSGLVGSLCDDDEDCEAPNVCNEDSGVHVCIRPHIFSPCDENSDCPGSTCISNRCGPHITCSNDADCAAANADGRHGVLHCWNGKCKQNGTASVCHGPGDCSDIPGGRGFCYDGAIQNRSGIAGICVESGAAVGCDVGHDDQCRLFNPNAVCRRLQSNWGNDGMCTYKGAGLPCVGPSGSGGDTVTNTCDPPLVCPQGVYRCVRPPGCPSS